MKNKRTLIIIIAVIAALLAATLIVLGINPDEKKENNTARAETYTVYSADAADIAEVRVETADGEIRAVNKGQSKWTINDLEEGEVDANKAYNLAGTVSTIISKNKFDTSEGLAQYGLDKPQITVTITKKNGDSTRLYVGDLSPTLGEYFIMPQGDDSVYTLYSYKGEALLKPLSYYTDFDRFDVNIDDITDIRIERADGNVEIRLKDKENQSVANVWEMVEPYTANANDDYVDNKILAPIENISLSEPLASDTSPFTENPVTLIITVKPYDSATGEYGGEYTETLLIEEPSTAAARVMYKGDMYETSADSVGFVKDSAFNIVSKLGALTDISLVKGVTLEYGGETHRLDIAHDGKKYTFKIDGKDTDAAVSQEIYRNIISLAVDAVYSGEEAGETVLTVRYEGKSSADSSVVEIKKINDIDCVLERDGKAEFTIKKSKVDEFITLFDAYVKAHE